MVGALQLQGCNEPERHPDINPEIFADDTNSLEQFVTNNSMILFERLSLPSGFLSTEPDTWRDDEEYNTARATMSGLKVVNDHAERSGAGPRVQQEVDKERKPAPVPSSGFC